MPKSKQRKKKREPIRYVWVETTYFRRRYRMKCTPEAPRRISMNAEARKALQSMVDTHDEKLHPDEYKRMWAQIDFGEKMRAQGELTSNEQFAQMLGHELKMGMPELLNNTVELGAGQAFDDARPE